MEEKMSEKKTLSKVERFALAAAREKVTSAQGEFNQLIEEVAEAHGISKEDGPNWRFSPDFSTVTFFPPKPPAPPAVDSKGEEPETPAE
jgi:hypothetical protein